MSGQDLSPEQAQVGDLVIVPGSNIRAWIIENENLTSLTRDIKAPLGMSVDHAGQVHIIYINQCLTLELIKNEQDINKALQFIKG